MSVKEEGCGDKVWGELDGEEGKVHLPNSGVGCAAAQCDIGGAVQHSWLCAARHAASERNNYTSKRINQLHVSNAGYLMRNVLL